MMRSRTWSSFLVPLAILVLAALAWAGSGARPARAASPDVVISEVYGGGGNSGATYRNDFIELFNRGSVAVDVTGWSVQYASATGGSWQVTPISGTIQPGQYYLVQQAAGSGGTTNLPAPDAVGSIAMAAGSGKVALVTSTTALTCGAAAGDCSSDASIKDFVGYGTANNFEGAAAAPALSNTTSAQRNGGGCVDTDNNGADFAGGAPEPENTASPLNPCGGGGSTPTNTPAVTPTATSTPSGLEIHDIQGAAHRSPYEGHTVNGVEGIVTALRSNGFYMQDPTPDGNEATSEGIFVFLNARPNVAVGDAVVVGGAVSEFRPGGSGGGDNLTITQIGSATVVSTSGGNPLPTVLIGAGGRMPPTTIIEDDASCGDVEVCGAFDPAQDGLDFYESLEGMRLQVNNAVAVGPSNDFGEIAVLTDDGAYAGLRTPRGGIIVRPGDFNPERIILDDVIAPTPEVNVGDHFSGPIFGVMDYSFGNFKLLVTNVVTAVRDGAQRESAAAAGANQLAVGTFNVENLAGTDPQAKYDQLAGLIVNNLKAPDILAIEEIQDNNGATNDQVVDASVTWTRLITTVQGLGGPRYDYRQINPVDDQDGGQPGGNIRVGFLFRTDRGLTFVDRPGGTPTSTTTILNAGGEPRLSSSPGRVDPTNPAWEASRKPLAGEFMYNGHHLFVIANHFASKGGDDPLFGHLQPPVRSSEFQRLQQAQVVNSFVDRILKVDPGAMVIVAGDLNDFQFSETLEALTGGQAQVLYNLIETLPENEQYTYVFDGNSQALDYILATQSLLSRLALFDVVHVNAEFAARDRASDHDPSVAHFNLAMGPTATATSTAVPPTATGTPVPPTATSTAPPPTATARPCAGEPYSDVGEADYFWLAVNWLYCRGAVDALPAGSDTFRPYQDASRAVIVKMIVVANGFPINTAGGPRFADVPPGHPYYQYIETAYNRGIISGYSPADCPGAQACFKPDNNVTRGQIAKIVTIAQGWTVQNPATPTFRDVPPGNPFYGWIETAYDHYVISGYDCGAPEPCPGGYYRPGSPATRGQVAKIVYLAVVQPDRR